jgi:hypothetical protein
VQQMGHILYLDIWFANAYVAVCHDHYA